MQTTLSGADSSAPDDDGDPLRRPVEPADIRNAHRVLLGRPVAAVPEVLSRSGLSGRQLIDDLVRSAEFRCEIVASLLLTGFAGSGRYVDRPRHSLLTWAAAFLPLTPKTRAALLDIADWRPLLRSLLTDPAFSAACGEPLPDVWSDVVSALSSRPDDVEPGTPGLVQLDHPEPVCGQVTFALALRHPARPSLIADYAGSGRNLACLRPTHGLNATKDKSLFTSAGDDPQLTIAERLSPGDYTIALRARFTDLAQPGKAVTAKLYLDFGSGFDESSAWAITTSTGRLDLIGRLSTGDPVRALRFDPSNDACSIQIERLGIWHLEPAASVRAAGVPHR